VVTLSKPQSSTDNRFPKSVRILKQVDFDRVHQGNVYAADNTLVIKAVTNSLGRCRLGLSVSKKVGNAVVRNHWKRRIREAFRLQLSDLPTGLDLGVRPRKGADCDFHLIAQSLKKLAHRIDRQIQKSRS
jgi:ribonuclease P protein component